MNKQIEERKFPEELVIITCAACGYMDSHLKFYISAIHSKFRICPKCGTVRFLCEENKQYGIEQ